VDDREADFSAFLSEYLNWNGWEKEKLKLFAKFIPTHQKQPFELGHPQWQLRKD